MYEKEFCKGCVCHDCINRAECYRCKQCIDGSSAIDGCPYNEVMNDNWRDYTGTDDAEH